MNSKRMLTAFNALLILTCLVPIVLALAGLAPQGTYDAHDPSRIVLNKGTYYYFSTGDKIRMHYSADMIHWNVGPSPLPNGVPQWVKAAVPANGGDGVWAPDLIFNPATKLWTMFYAYSSFGSQTSVIGALTSPDLTTDSFWKDAGLVIASNGSVDFNAIDPCPLYLPGKTPSFYLTFGSYWSGIKGVQLNPITLKPIGQPTALSGSPSGVDMEASFIWYQGGYYYLFFTRGQCCQGVNSTYYILFGRSKSPLGPYVDKAGVPLLAGGGTPFYDRKGSMIGPGQIGIALLDGTLRASFHYYDGNADGAPKLGIQALLISADGWLAMGSDLPDGTYRIVSRGSGLSLGVAGESNVDGTSIDQWKWLNHDYQKWSVTRQVDGTYSILSKGNGKAMHVRGGGDGPLTDVVEETWTGNDAQRWIIDQQTDGSYRIRTMTGTVLEEPNAVLGTHAWTNLWVATRRQKWTFGKL